MVGSSVMGFIVDKIGSRTGCVFNMINIVIVWAVSYGQIQMNKDNFLVYAFTFFWGFSDGAVCIHTDTILGFEFDTAQDPFSVCICIQSIGAVVFQIIQGVIDEDSEVTLKIYTSFVCIIGVCLCAITLLFDFRV